MLTQQMSSRAKSRDPLERNRFMSNEYYVYILTNRYNNLLYVGVTNDIVRRISEHKSHSIEGFTKKYSIDKCVYVESCSDISAAIAREKQLKKWTRKKKFDLINTQNPDLNDLFDCGN